MPALRILAVAALALSAGPAAAAPYQPGDDALVLETGTWPLDRTAAPWRQRAHEVEPDDPRRGGAGKLRRAPPPLNRRA